jgi:hypothetical protein
MALTQLAKPEWQDYFDGVSKVLGAKLVEIEVAGLGLGDQVEVNWLPLIGLSYDPRGDVLAVIVEGIEHNIQHPKQIYVEQDVEGLYSIEVVDTVEEHHILLLKDPLKLPPA